MQRQINFAMELKTNNRQKSSGNISFVNGTNDCEACPKRWIAVLVQVNCERSSANKLSNAGFETYIPTQQEIHQWSDRKKKVDRILIPMTIFVKATVNEERWLRDQTFIFKLLALPGSDENKHGYATPIPDEQIDNLKFLLEHAEDTVSMEKTINIGDTVSVVGGPLRGIKAIVSETSEKCSIVAIQITGLGYACVKIDKKYLEP